MKILQDITLGQYLPGNSFLHRLDPRSKSVSLIFLIIAILNAYTTASLTVLALLVLGTCWLTSFPLHFLLGGVKLFFWLFVFTALFHLFFTPGDTFPPFPMAGMSITKQGLHQGLTVFVQLFLCILSANIFTLTTEPMLMTKGFERLIRPLKVFGVKTDEISLMLTLVIRFIPVMKEEALKIVTAQKGRGVDFSTLPFMKKCRNIMALLGPLFTNIFSRSDRIVIAMASRGFGQGPVRGSLKELLFRKEDYLALLTAVFFFLYAINC